MQKGLMQLPQSLSRQTAFFMKEQANYISNQYERSGLMEAVEQFIASVQKKGPLSAASFEALDQFHVRGAAISRELASMAGIEKNMRVLDAGCGLGGAARMLAAGFGCHVTGVDITASYISIATKLSALAGQQNETRFLQGDLLYLPFPNNHFDLIWTQHVQMNIEAKASLYQELFRLVKPGGRLLYYDVLGNEGGSLLYPLPWADTAAQSFVISSSRLTHYLEEAGFHKELQRDETLAGIAAIEKWLNKNQDNRGGLIILMGARAIEKMQHLLQHLKEGRLQLQSGLYKKEK